MKTTAVSLLCGTLAIIALFCDLASVLAVAEGKPTGTTAIVNTVTIN